jgi:D-alanyl-D-alanine dipeptidase
LHDLTGDLAAQSVAVSDRMWAAVLLRLQQVFPRARFQRLQTFLARLRMVKSESELELLRRAAHMGDRAFEKIVELRFTGRTERTIARDLEELLTGEGLAGGRVGPIVASGPNAASPHHEAGDREIHEGDAVVLDFGGSVDGYQADITRTVYVGIPDTEFRHVYDVLRQAQDAGVAAVRPDVPAESVDRAAREVIDAAGYGAFFMHRTGHGIGLDGHEEPFIIASNTLPLRTGMTFSVEPGIYLPGRFGARIEDIVAVTADGQERLNAAPRDLIVVH